MDPTAVHHVPLYAVALASAADGRFVYVSDEFCKRLGYARPELLGRTAAELGIWVDPADRERLVALLHQRGAVDEFAARFRRRDGSLVHSLVTAYLLDIDGREFTLGLAQSADE